MYEIKMHGFLPVGHTCTDKLLFLLSSKQIIDVSSKKCGTL